MEEERLFEAIGSFGRWQKEIYAVLFYSNIVGIWQNFAMTFLTPNVPFRCVDSSDNHTTGDDDYWPGQCVLSPNDTVPCREWEYNSTDSLVSEWDLVCDREWLISFAKSVYMIGFMASVFVFGQVSDWIGRYPTMLICYVITCSSMVATLFSYSIEFFLVFRFLQAFGRTGLTTTGYVLVMETVGPSRRTDVGISVQLGWCSGMSLLALIGYFFRHWFWFQVATAVPLLPIAAAFFILPESPRWLLMHGKTDRLEKVLAAAAQKNGKPAITGEQLQQILKAKEVSNENGGTMLDLFRTPIMRARTFNMMYLWVVNAFVYYALTFNTNDLSGDPYLNFLVAGFLEFPSYAMLYLCVRRFGRRPVMVALMLAGGATCLALVFVPADLAWLATALSQCGKFCVTASFGLVYLYTGEMYPTVVRSAALGSCSTVSRIGSIVAPFSRELGKASHPSVPNVLYTVLAVSSGLFALRLPETAGCKLPDTLEEAEGAFDNDKKH